MDEQFSELLTVEDDGELARLLAALAKASKEQDRFITVTISIAADERKADEGGEDAN